VSCSQAKWVRIGIVHEPNHFWRSLTFVSQQSNLDTIPVNRVVLVSARRSTPEKRVYPVLQHGIGFRWHTDGSGDGQQHGHAVRHGFTECGLQTFNEPGRNLIEPQARLGGVTLARAAPFEGCDVNSHPIPSDREIGTGGSRLSSHVAENLLPTASMAARSCFFKSLMPPDL